MRELDNDEEDEPTVHMSGLALLEELTTPKFVERSEAPAVIEATFEAARIDAPPDRPDRGVALWPYVVGAAIVAAALTVTVWLAR